MHIVASQLSSLEIFLSFFCELTFFCDTNLLVSVIEVSMAHVSVATGFPLM